MGPATTPLVETSNYWSRRSRKVKEYPHGGLHWNSASTKAKFSECFGKYINLYLYRLQVVKTLQAEDYDDRV